MPQYGVEWATSTGPKCLITSCLVICHWKHTHYAQYLQKFLGLSKSFYKTQFYHKCFFHSTQRHLTCHCSTFCFEDRPTSQPTNQPANQLTIHPTKRVNEAPVDKASPELQNPCGFCMSRLILSSQLPF